MTENTAALTKTQKLFKIFLSTLYLSAFTFGGGYVIVTLLRKKFVEELHWIDEEEMLEPIRAHYEKTHKSSAI